MEVVREVVRDDKRDILWLTKGKHTSVWSKTLEYEVRIEDLVIATKVNL